MNGLPPHIAQVIVGHRDINVTIGYKAVYPGDYSFITFSDFSVLKLRRSARRKVLHNSTGKDEHFLRTTGNLGHGNGPSF